MADEVGETPANPNSVAGAPRSDHRCCQYCEIDKLLDVPVPTKVLRVDIGSVGYSTMFADFRRATRSTLARPTIRDPLVHSNLCTRCDAAPALGDQWVESHQS